MLAPGRLGRGARQSGLCPQLSASPQLPHQLLTAQAFPGCLTLCCSPPSEFLCASLHIPASCVWAPSWRTRGQCWKIALGADPGPTPAETMSQTLALVLLARDCAARWREKTGVNGYEAPGERREKGWRHPKSTYFGLASSPVCGLQESLWGHLVRASAKASRPLGTMVWNAEDARVPPGEKRGSGGGEPGSLLCPLGFTDVSPGSRAGKTSGKRLRSTKQYH